MVLEDKNSELVLSAHIDMGECKIGKLLGVLWNDKNKLNVNELEREANQTPVTKRQLLCIIASIFDPLSSFTVKLKVLLQTLCINDTNWDESLSKEALQAWNMMSSQLQLLSKVKVTRCYYDLNHIPNEVKVHGFYDTSEWAYAAVLYILCIYDANHVDTRLVTFKARMAPIKKQNYSKA